MGSTTRVSRRSFLALGLGGAAGLALMSACTQPGAAPSAAGGGSAAQPVTLRFLTTESDPPSKTVYDAAAAAFTAENPNVKIEMEYVGFAGRPEKLVTDIGAKKAPQITQLVAYEIIQYGRLGFLAPLDDIVTEGGGRDKWQPASIVASIIDNKVFALPYNGGNSRMLWHRTDLFQQAGLNPPKNWEEWKQVAQALTKDTNGDGNPDQFGLALPGSKTRATLREYMRLLWQTGETVFDKDFNVVFGKEGAVRALQYFQDMVKFGPPGYASYDNNEVIDAFVSGKAATIPYSGRPLSRVNDSAPNLLSATHAVWFPSGPIGGNVGPVTWDNYAVFNEKVGVKPAEQDAAKKFLKYLLTGKAATDFALTVPGHLIPPYLPTLQDDHLWNGSPLMTSHKPEITLLYDTSNSLDYVTEAGATITAEKVTPGQVNPYWPAVDGGLVIPAMVQRVLVQNETPKAAVEWGATEIKRVVDDARAKSKSG
jgi:multiple sugar transport system substrate-binding protein